MSSPAPAPASPAAPILEELANPAEQWYGALAAHRDDNAAAALRAEAAQGRAPRDVYALFQEMEDKDGHLFAILQTRKNGLLARERKVVPADGSPEALESARLVERLLGEIGDFEQGLASLLDGLAKGFAVAEILWRRNPDGSYGVSALRGRPQSRFVFRPDGALCLVARPGASPAASANPNSHQQVPAGKFLVLSFGSPTGNPYGKGLCLKCYWPYWLKRNNLKFWAIYNERFGAPAVVGKYPPGATERERARLLEVIDSIQSDCGITLPEGMNLEFLEARRGGDGGRTYRELADWANDEMSKAVLGATLVASEGRRSGSLALGQVHQNIRGEYIEADAKLLMDVINRQLIPHLVRVNLGARAPLPRWVIDLASDDNLAAEAEIDRALLGIGVPIPLSYFYERYRRPVPREGDRALRYDDANLYQYHLQFGVLTINEVRKTLGLPAVSWGDVPPQLTGALNQPGLAAQTSEERTDPPEHDTAESETRGK